MTPIIDPGGRIYVGARWLIKQRVHILRLHFFLGFLGDPQLRMQLMGRIIAVEARTSPLYYFNIILSFVNHNLNEFIDLILNFS